MTAQVAPRPRVLADLVPGTLVRDIAVVIGAARCSPDRGADLDAAAIHSGADQACRRSPSCCGARRSGRSVAGCGMLLYIGVGLLRACRGSASSGQATSRKIASFRYIVGFIVTTTLSGALAQAQRGARKGGLSATWMDDPRQPRDLCDRRRMAGELCSPLTCQRPLSWCSAILIGDTLKIALAAGLLPAAWKLAGNRPSG